MAHTSRHVQKEGESLCHLAFAHWLKFSEAQVPFIQQYAQEARALAQQIGNQKILARSLISLGFVHQVRGDLAASDRQHEAALQISRREGYPDTLASSLLWLSAHAYWRGDFSSAQPLGQESLTVARAIHDGIGELLGLAFLSTICWSTGDYVQALTLLHEGRAKAKERDNLFISARLLNTFGWFLREFGATLQAVDYDQESLEGGRVSGVSNVEICALITLGLDHLALGHHDHALSYLEPTLERVEHEIFGTERWCWKVRLLLGIAELWHTTSEYDQALRYVEAGIKEAQRTSSKKYIALGLALHGKIVTNLGDTETSGADLQRAFSLAEQLQSPSLIYPIAYDLGRWHERSGHEREAATLYGKATSTIEQMATAVGDEALRTAFLQSALVQAIHERATRLGG